MSEQLVIGVAALVDMCDGPFEVSDHLLDVDVRFRGPPPIVGQRRKDVRGQSIVMVGQLVTDLRELAQPEAGCEAADHRHLCLGVLEESRRERLPPGLVIEILVRRVEYVHVGWQSGFQPVFGQDAQCEGVDRADCRVVNLARRDRQPVVRRGALAERCTNPQPKLCRGSLGESDRGDRGHGQARDGNQRDDPLDHQGGLAASGGGIDDQAAFQIGCDATPNVRVDQVRRAHSAHRLFVRSTGSTRATPLRESSVGSPSALTEATSGASRTTDHRRSRSVGHSRLKSQWVQ